MKIDFQNPWCSTITDGAKRMVLLVAEHKVTVYGEFNGIGICAGRRSTVETIVASYHAKYEARYQAYLNSPEGKAAAAKAAAYLRQMQETHDALVVQLGTLDFTDDVAVLDWLAAYQDPSDHIGVKRTASVVVATFKSHGYEPNVNLGDESNEEDRDNTARYLIGQALDGLSEVGAIHQVFHSFHERWKMKFLPQAA